MLHWEYSSYLSGDTMSKKIISADKTKTTQQNDVGSEKLVTNIVDIKRSFKNGTYPYKKKISREKYEKTSMNCRSNY